MKCRLCSRIREIVRFAGVVRSYESGSLVFMTENDWTRVLGWPGYKVYRAEIDERAKRLKLWVRRKRGNKQLICSGLRVRPSTQLTSGGSSE